MLEADFSFLPLAAEPAWQQAKELASGLLRATAVSEVALHADLHHDNIIGRSGNWLAIDPKGLFGDPVYDVANVFRNPHGGGDLVATSSRIDMLADVFAQRLGWDRRRILCWAAVHSAISAVWDHAAGNSTESDIRMAPILLKAAVST